MFYSELVFWSKLDPSETTFSDLLIMWFLYSALAYVFLSTITEFKVGSFWTLFLIGALFGWLVEGLIVQTLYESLPLSIFWAGLAWHSLISVSIGWYAIRKALKEGNRRRIMQISSLFGLFWGFWSITWWAEEKRITPLSDIQSTYCYPVFFSPLLTGCAREFNFSPLK